MYGHVPMCVGALFGVASFVAARNKRKDVREQGIVFWQLPPGLVPLCCLLKRVKEQSEPWSPLTIDIIHVFCDLRCLRCAAGSAGSSSMYAGLGTYNPYEKKDADASAGSQAPQVCSWLLYLMCMKVICDTH